MPLALEPNQLSALQHVMTLCDDNGGEIPYDPCDDLQTIYYEAILELNGRTKDRYPALHNTLTQANVQQVEGGVGDNTGTFVDNEIINFLGPRNSGLAGGGATLTRNKPITSATLIFSVVNVNAGTTTVLATGTNTIYAGTQTVNTITSDANALQWVTTGSNYGVMTWFINYQDGSTESNTNSSIWGYNTSQDPTYTVPIINPNRHVGNLNNIVVGLSRGFNSAANNTDVDYWFWQTQWQNTTLIVPVTGSMYFKYPIATLNLNNPIPFVYLARVEGGMSELQASGIAMPQFTIDPVNPNKLNFSFVAGTNDAGTALNFGLSPWVSDTKTYLTFKIVVTLNAPGQPGLQGWSTIMSADTPNTDPNDGVTTIPPIMFLWHCLVAGTLVTMGDNTTKAIEDLVLGDIVATPTGNQMVQANLAQPHFGTTYTLTLSSGKTISCSGTHPVITPTGPVQVASLVVGNTVLVSGGSDTVASISTFQQNGDGLFNIWLNGAADTTVFYANGILVGDYQIQVSSLDEERTNPTKVKARLPEEWQKDFDSHQEDLMAASK